MEREQWTNNKLRNILQNNYKTHFKIFKVMTIKDKGAITDWKILEEHDSQVLSVILY